MTTLLAIDSCNETFSCAIVADLNTESAIIYKKIIANYHATVALPLISDALLTAQITLPQIDVFAFNAGPGKFSALRLICAIARSFAYANKKQLIAVPAFCALANANFDNNATLVKIAYPAHKDHVYWGTCKREQLDWVLDKNPTTIANNTSPPPQKNILHACGSGFKKSPHLLGKATLGHIEWTNAKHIATTAINMYHTEQFTPPIDAQPIYARKKIAKTIKERQQLKNNAS